MAKATTHPTCTPTNLNIRTRFSTLYANAPILLASILLNFRRRPESHLQLQVSEKFQNGTATFRSAVIHPLPCGEELRENTGIWDKGSRRHMSPRQPYPPLGTISSVVTLKCS